MYDRKDRWALGYNLYTLEFGVLLLSFEDMPIFFFSVASMKESFY